MHTCTERFIRSVFDTRCKGDSTMLTTVVLQGMIKTMSAEDGRNGMKPLSDKEIHHDYGKQPRHLNKVCFQHDSEVGNISLRRTPASHAQGCSSQRYVGTQHVTCCLTIFSP